MRMKDNIRYNSGTGFVCSPILPQITEHIIIIIEMCSLGSSREAIRPIRGPSKLYTPIERSASTVRPLEHFERVSLYWRLRTLLERNGVRLPTPEGLGKLRHMVIRDRVLVSRSCEEKKKSKSTLQNQELF